MGGHSDEGCVDKRLQKWAVLHSASLFKSRLMWHVAWDKACGMGQEICEAMGPLVKHSRLTLFC